MPLDELAGVHVLVVPAPHEDTDDSRELLRVVLEYCGALVTAAASVEQARRILDTLRPHVLVTDIGMPDGGVALIREVKGMVEIKGLRVPVIAVTAYTGRREQLLAEGFEDILEKPIDPKTLCGVVRRHAALEG